MLNLINARLSRGTKVLLENAGFGLFEKQKMGLTGRNGCGKSSLFKLILQQLSLDSGELQLNQNCRISHLSQEIPDSEETAIEFVLHGDEDYQRIQQQLAMAEKNHDHETVLACHEQLTQTGGYSKPSQAASILSGLGFTTEQQQHKVNSFSGGWRMRLSLGRCLMKPAELLLLDEPTNHLDMEAIFWLEKWLKQSPAALLVISHDREFLDGFTTHILHIENQQATLYTGNYSQFETTRAQKLALQQAMHEKQQKQIRHLQSFVDRFKAKASKAKQAQSRVKAIERMEIVAAAQVDSPFSFEFFPCPRASNPLIRCDKLSAGYSNDNPLFNQVNFNLNMGNRLALLGPNGAGKSTFIKTLTGKLAPLSGEVQHSQHLKIGYFAQHQLETLNSELSPVQTIQKLSPEAREQSIRDFLGGFNFRNDMATHPITHFSGGEKARLALAKLVWQKPNVLLLDEPTNHLDLDMRAAIELALQEYEGALILISHDRHLLKMTVDEYYLLNDKTIRPFDGDLNDYYSWLVNRNQTSVKEEVIKPTATHQDRRAIQNKIKKTEQLISQLQQQQAQVQQQLAAPWLYEQENSRQLQQLIDEQNKLNQSLDEHEQQWFALCEQLESAG